jgi:MYXO-CTERM domain-containing protein
MMDCLREVYRPYDIEVTDIDPGEEVPHHEAVAAGSGSDLLIEDDRILGRAPGGCDPLDNQISFSFLNAHTGGPVFEMCATVAQESAHSFGIPDHVWDCTDPMTYRVNCGQKFFRNKQMPCGAFDLEDPPCVCGVDSVNTHAQLLAVFGPGQDPFPPTVEIVSPTEGGELGEVVSVQFDDARGVYRAELWINGWRWDSWVQDAVLNGPPPTSHEFDIPGGLPDGTLDIEVIVYNDLAAEASASVTAQKGDACQSADTCAEGQMCEDGRCFWEQPSQAFGESCEFDQQCIGEPDPYSGSCVQDTEGRTMCTRSCFAGVNDDCPTGFACLAADGEEGVCWFDEPEDGGGCCSTGGGDGGRLYGSLALGAMLGAIVLRRRRRPSTRARL